MADRTENFGGVCDTAATRDTTTMLNLAGCALAINATVASITVPWPEGPATAYLAAQMAPRQLYKAAQNPGARTAQIFQLAAAKAEPSAPDSRRPCLAFDAKAAKTSFVRQEFEWIDRVALDAQLAPLACRVAVKLLSYFNSKTGEAYPGQERLAAELNVDPRSIIRATNALVRRGHQAIRPPKAGRGIANVYRMALKRVTAESPFLSLKGDRNVTLNGQRRVTNLAQKGDKSCSKRVTTESPQPSEEPSEEPSARFASPPEPAACAPSLVHLCDGPQWDAWVVHWRKTRGISPPRDRKGGWYFPSEWPPGEELEAGRIPNAVSLARAVGFFRRADAPVLLKSVRASIS